MKNAINFSPLEARNFFMYIITRVTHYSESLLLLTDTVVISPFHVISVDIKGEQVCFLRVYR